VDEALRAQSEREFVEAVAHCTAVVYQGCTVRLLIALPDSSLALSCYQLHGGGGAAAGGLGAECTEGGSPRLQPVVVALKELPSVMAAIAEAKLLFHCCSAGSASSASGAAGVAGVAGAEGAQLHADWEEARVQQGMNAFLVVPMLLAHKTLGALVVMAPEAAAIDSHQRKLSLGVALQLAQALYTRSALEQARAGDSILNDILPAKVRGGGGCCARCLGGGKPGPCLQPCSPAALLAPQPVPQPATPQPAPLPACPRRPAWPSAQPRRWRAMWGPRLPAACWGRAWRGRLAAAPSRRNCCRLLPAHAQVAEHLKQRHRKASAVQGRDAGGGREGLAAGQQAEGPADANQLLSSFTATLQQQQQDQGGVLYKQWHANVSILFADIVGYTALSQQVEPEQVRRRRPHCWRLAGGRLDARAGNLGCRPCQCAQLAPCKRPPAHTAHPPSAAADHDDAAHAVLQVRPAVLAPQRL
jgi:hypothetical protein